MSTNKGSCSEDKSICGIVLVAHDELEKCCGECCNRDIIMDYITALEDKIEAMQKELNNGN